MTDAPERIWVAVTPVNGCDWRKALTHEPDLWRGHYRPYIRADLAPQWQPIETAPRDGTWVLLYQPPKWLSDRVDMTNWIARWNYDEWRDQDEALVVESPTHWMPLPQPPEDAE